MYSVNVVSVLLKEYLWERCCFLGMVTIKAEMNKIGIPISMANNLPGNELKNSIYAFLSM